MLLNTTKESSFGLKYPPTKVNSWKGDSIQSLKPLESIKNSVIEIAKQILSEDENREAQNVSRENETLEESDNHDDEDHIINTIEEQIETTSSRFQTPKLLGKKLRGRLDNLNAVTNKNFSRGKDIDNNDLNGFEVM